MNLYVFGNEYLAQDSMARRVSEHLQGIDIVHCHSPEELLEADEEIITILDVVVGITKPIVITDITKLKTRNLVSMHDFDLGFFLKLMKELGQEKHVRIIGVPQAGDAKALAKDVEKLI